MTNKAHKNPVGYHFAFEKDKLNDRLENNDFAMIW